MYTKANYVRCNGTQCLNQLFDGSRLAAIVPRKFAKHFQSTAKHPIFCFANSESFSKVTRTLSGSNSYLLKKINLFIRRAMETGHLLKWETVGTGHNKYESDRDGSFALTVQHFSGPLLIYAVGNTFALLALIFERLTFKNIPNNDHGFWKWLDKFIFSPERLFWNGGTSGYP